MREVDLATFASAHASGAVVIDVREPEEYVSGHVPGAQLMPLAQLPNHAGALPRPGPVYVICASGRRSLSAVDYLAGLGVTAYSVTDGTGGWIRSGRIVVRGSQATA